VNKPNIPDGKSLPEPKNPEKKPAPEEMPGEKNGINGIVIDKSENKLYVYENGDPAVVFEVATGKEPHFTPEGTFYIANKINFSDEAAGSSETGKPEFGARWLGLAVPGGKDRRGPPGDERAPAGVKYGIHGTNEPESIGNHASGGCIRMRNADIVRLFEMVEIGTKVEIRP